MVQWLSDEEQRAWRGFVQMWMHITAATADGFAADGLSESDYAVLVALSERAPSRMRARDLAVDVCWDKSRLSKQVTRMEARGLLRRELCEEDARGSWVVLTDAGREAIERAAPRHVEVVRACFVDRLDAQDLAALERIAEKVLGPG